MDRKEFIEATLAMVRKMLEDPSVKVAYSRNIVEDEPRDGAWTTYVAGRTFILEINRKDVGGGVQHFAIAAMVNRDPDFKVIDPKPGFMHTFRMPRKS